MAVDPLDLEFKESCDGCEAHLGWVSTAYICSHECTWCSECAEGCSMICPNCSGDLKKRPSRTQKIGR